MPIIEKRQICELVIRLKIFNELEKYIARFKLIKKIENRNHRLGHP